MSSTAPNPELNRILNEYGRAWETHDTELVLSLFTADATYQESPFSAPMAGHSAIRGYWDQATGPHRDVQFRWQLVGSMEGLHIVEWTSSFLREGAPQRIELRGIMLLELRGDRIFRFREYWVRRQNVPPT